MKTPSGQVLSIQYLRGVAAVIVIGYHALGQFDGFNRVLPTEVGASGVDMFFVISGFVMSYSTRIHDYSRGAFLLRRAVRIVPIYWIATLVTASVLVLGAQLVRHSVFAWDHFLASLFFIPMYNPGEPATISPILKLGWTLNYEMYFYLIFAALVPVRPWLRMAIITVLFAVVVLAARLVPSAPAPLAFWGSPIVFEFLLGCAVAELYFSETLKRVPRKVLGVAVLGAIAGLIAGGSGKVFGFDPIGGTRVLYFGIPAALLIASVIGFEQSKEAQRKRPVALFIGDASYSIYLSHLYAVISMRILWSRLALPAEGLPWAFVFLVLCLLAGTALGCLVYVCVERPATAYIKALVIRTPSRRVPATSRSSRR